MAVAPSPTEGLSAQAIAQFEVLRKSFVAGLDARWQAIVQAPTREARYGLLHQLIGSAGSYGFSALSQAAQQALNALDFTPPSAHQPNTLSDSLDAVQHHIQQAMASYH
jgi:hypothetical protein